MTQQAGPRPMRRIKREVTDSAELRSIVERARVLRVGFTDAEGMAIVPMNFGVEWDDSSLPTLWLHSAREGRKAEAWAGGSDVALELDVEGGVTTGTYACAYSYAYESVMAWGHLAPVTDPAEKLRGLRLIMAHMAPGAPVAFSEEAVARVAVWRIDVTRLTGKRREAQGGAAATSPTTTPKDHPTMSDKDSKNASKKKDASSKKKAKKHGLLDELEAKLKSKKKHGKGDKGGDHGAKKGDADLKRKAKADRKALEKATEAVLKGQHCDGCGHHCKLTSPRCGKGKKLRAKRLAKAGLKA